MGADNSKASETKAEGPMSNANSNNLTIIETVQEHTSMVSTLLLIISILMIIAFVYKLYKMHKRCIQKQESKKSRITLTNI